MAVGVLITGENPAKQPPYSLLESFLLDTTFATEA
jgi:hypothetical protein